MNVATADEAKAQLEATFPDDKGKVLGSGATDDDAMNCKMP
jgi:hypothetical protein